MPRGAALSLPKGIAFLFEKGQRVPRSKSLAALAAKVVREEGLRGKVNLVFCSDEKIRSLNRDHRGIDRITDVLSFPWQEPDFAGEIYIANLQAKRQAPRWKNTYFKELQRLLVHGVLHLCGYDHMKNQERIIMRQKEKDYLKNP